MDHSEARKKVCVVCFCKASRLSISYDVEYIRDHVIVDYAVKNPDLPCAICGSCWILLTKHRNGDTKIAFPVVSHDNPGTQVLTRGQSVCQCRICEVAKSNGFTVKSMKGKRGRPCTTPALPDKPCTTCFSVLYSGYRHSQVQRKSKKCKHSHFKVS